MSLVNAIAKKNEKKVTKLISEGTDVNKPDRLGFIPLCEAAYTGNVKITKMLLKAGAEINLCDARGKSPLSWAVYPGGNIDIVKLLIASGADVNQQTPVDEIPSMASPAHLVFFHDSYSILIHLIRAGADLTIKNSNGKTPLEVGKFVNPFSTCVKILEKVSEIKNSELNETQKSNNIELFLKKTEREKAIEEARKKHSRNRYKFMAHSVLNPELESFSSFSELEITDEIPPLNGNVNP